MTNGIRNVPTTTAALKSPDVKPDEQFNIFLDIFANPNTSDDPDHARGQREPGSRRRLRDEVPGRARSTTSRAGSPTWTSRSTPSSKPQAARRCREVSRAAEAAPVTSSGRSTGAPRGGGRPGGDAASGARLHEPLAPRLHDLLRLPAGHDRVLLVHALRPALVAEVGRARELPVPLQRRPAHLAGRLEHALDHRRRGAAQRHLRVRHRGDAARGRGAGSGSSARSSTCPRSCRRSRRRSASSTCSTRAPGRSTPARASRARGPALVRLADLVEAVARPARPLGRREPDDHLPGRRHRRARATCTSRRSSTAPERGSACAG